MNPKPQPRFSASLLSLASQSCPPGQAAHLESGTLQALLQTLLVFSEHPSQLLASNYTAVFWSDVLQNKEWLQRYPEVVGVAVPPLLRFVETKFRKVGGPEEEDSPACEYSAMDFDTTADHATMVGGLRSRLIVLCTALGTCDISASICFLGERLGAVLKQVAEAEAAKDAAQLQVAVGQLEPVVGMMNPVLERAQADTEPYDPQLAAITQMVLGHRTEELSVMLVQLTGLSALVKHLARVPGTLLAVMQLILERMWYMAPDEALCRMSPSVVGLRRKAGQVLGYVFKHVKEPALQYCSELRSMAQGLFAQGKATSTEMATLHEAMLGAVAVRGPNAMLEFSTEILTGPMQAPSL